MANQYDEPFDLDPDLARLGRAQQGAAVDLSNLPTPPSAFVASINGQTGPVSLDDGSLPAGWAVTFSASPGVVAINISGPGTMSTKDVASAVADLNQTILGPTIAEVQAISDKVDEILGVLRAAGHILP